MKLKTLKRLLSYVKPYALLVVIAFILAAAAVALTLTAPIITGRRLR